MCLVHTPTVYKSAIESIAIAAPARARPPPPLSGYSILLVKTSLDTRLLVFNTRPATSAGSAGVHARATSPTPRPSAPSPGANSCRRRRRNRAPTRWLAAGARWRGARARLFHRACSEQKPFTARRQRSENAPGPRGAASPVRSTGESRRRNTRILTPSGGATSVSATAAVPAKTRTNRVKLRTVGPPARMTPAHVRDVPVAASVQRGDHASVATPSTTTSAFPAPVPTSRPIHSTAPAFTTSFREQPLRTPA